MGISLSRLKDGFEPTFIELEPRHRLVDVDDRAKMIFLNGILQRIGVEHDYTIRRRNLRYQTITLKFNTPFQEGDVLGFLP